MLYYNIVFVICMGSALSVDNHHEVGSDQQHNQLHTLASNILQSMQNEYIPSDASHTGAHNAPLHVINNLDKNGFLSEFVDKTKKIKVTVGVKGVKFVSVESNGKVVNISEAFGVGAAALYTIVSDNNSDDDSYNRYVMQEETDQEIETIIKQMGDNYVDILPEAGRNETKIVLGQKAKFTIKIEPKHQNKGPIKVNVDHGYVAGAIVNVTKGYKNTN
ncbi:uncharacterized protein LOC128952194 [Oppia nitens]|uniref:uncharacterized protein LOC128952194 n=1 Tax=Oppia nitens TaxID=1686743 RepID=UPI0023DB5823|nr:uncharacterized protein LOC128952194 [Oppia nitens]